MQRKSKRLHNTEDVEESDTEKKNITKRRGEL